MSMEISNVNSSNNAQYTARTTDAVQEKTQTTPEEDRKKLGVILELSTNSEQAQSLAEKIRQRNENGERYVYPNAHRTTCGSNNDGRVSFYGASVTQEQSEKLQDVIKSLEQQEQDNLGESWNVGAYAQLGLKVSQLSYACKEMGLTDEAANQIVGTYGKQAEEKINKMNDWVSYAYEQAKVAREELYKKYGTPNYGANAKEIQESLVHKSKTGKTSVELNAEANSDIYQMFSTLDVSSKDAFKSSFEEAIGNYKSYLAGGEVPIYTGTSNQQLQLAGLTKMFQNFLG